MNKSKLKDDEITRILHNSKEIRLAMRARINAALLKHKLLGNPICQSQDGKVVWIQPEDIQIDEL